MSAPPRAERMIGDGKYELLSQIGTGAMGTVWLARHVALDRIVAVKMLNIVTRADSAARERFLSEARSASLLRHTNSVRILDYAAAGDECWLVMEFLEGRNLADILAEQGPLTARRSIAIGVQVLAAVAEAHEYGLVHRDLKPANIMLVPWIDDDGNETEHVKVLDFGIATLARADPGDNGDVAGTPEFMSPEQAQGLAVDARSDVYSVGVLLYLMVVGEVPFRGETAIKTMLAHVNTVPQAPRARNPDVPGSLETQVLKALNKNPEHRFRSARAMRSALLALPEAAGLRGDTSPRQDPVRPALGVPPAPIADDPVRQAEPRARRRWPLVALILLLGAAVALLVVIMQPGPTAPTARQSALALSQIEAPPQVRIAAPEEPPTTDVVAADASEATAPEEDAVAQAEPDTVLAQAPEAIAGPREERQPTARRELPPERAPTPKRTDPPARVGPADPKPAPEPSPVADVADTDPPRGEVTRIAAATPPQGVPNDVAESVADVSPKAVTPPPETTPPKPPPEPALAARVALRDLVVRGSLPRSSISRALATAVGALEECYRAAAKSAGRDSAGKLAASLVIDNDGRATEVQVAPFGLPGFTACARQALSRARSRDRPDTGSVSATLTLAITPLPPRQPSEAP